MIPLATPDFSNIIPFFDNYIDDGRIAGAPAYVTSGSDLLFEYCTEKQDIELASPINFQSIF